MSDDPVAVLERIAYLLERGRESTYRVRAYRGAADAIRQAGEERVKELAAAGRLKDLAGVGDKTEQIVLEVLAGKTPSYLIQLEGSLEEAENGPGAAVRAALKGDCHTHSDWSDGGSPIKTMAEAAIALGHEYMVLTDHSPRLTVAKGLSPERLRLQLGIVEQLNEELAPFRILTGIEVDILDDGALDQEEELLAQLDVVVASVHSKLRMDSEGMTKRMVAALASPHVDILGHCTGRLVVGRGRPESTFDAELVFACAEKFDKAVEVNSRPERLDPPRRLLRLAVDMGCKISIDTDAHAPGQLEWLPYGCERVAEVGVDLDRIVNTRSADDLLAWAASHAA
ncbi:MAG: PHP domain-containing protein [Actinobacteria bacterium]|nr:PHP domain-containing protein [Actinomycetota bacterium]MBV8961101.1 PHP domain-containing protein [Actinomycetota bacterium]MBV9254521.1 PHP domain-containing protein [Actinomycetota bacterium]